MEWAQKTFLERKKERKGVDRMGRESHGLLFTSQGNWKRQYKGGRVTWEAVPGEKHMNKGSPGQKREAKFINTSFCVQTKISKKEIPIRDGVAIFREVKWNHHPRGLNNRIRL